MPLADTKRQSTDTAGSTATEASSFGPARYGRTSNDFVAAKEMVQRDIDLVDRELERYHKAGRQVEGRAQHLPLAPSLVSIDEENPVTHTPQAPQGTGDFEGTVFCSGPSTSRPPRCPH